MNPIAWLSVFLFVSLTTRAQHCELQGKNVGCEIHEGDFFVSYYLNYPKSVFSKNRMDSLYQDYFTCSDSIVTFLPKIKYRKKISVSDLNKGQNNDHFQVYWSFWVGNEKILKKLGEIFEVQCWIEGASGTVIKQETFTVERSALAKK